MYIVYICIYMCVCKNYLGVVFSLFFYANYFLILFELQLLARCHKSAFVILILGLPCSQSCPASRRCLKRQTPVISESCCWSSRAKSPLFRSESFSSRSWSTIDENGVIPEKNGKKIRKLMDHWWTFHGFPSDNSPNFISCHFHLRDSMCGTRSLLSFKDYMSSFHDLLATDCPMHANKGTRGAHQKISSHVEP